MPSAYDPAHDHVPDHDDDLHELQTAGNRLYVVLSPNPMRLWLFMALAFVSGVGVGTVLTILGLTVGRWLP